MGRKFSLYNGRNFSFRNGKGWMFGVYYLAYWNQFQSSSIRFYDLRVSILDLFESILGLGGIILGFQKSNVLFWGSITQDRTSGSRFWAFGTQIWTSESRFWAFGTRLWSPGIHWDRCKSILNLSMSEFWPCGWRFWASGSQKYSQITLTLLILTSDCRFYTSGSRWRRLKLQFGFLDSISNLSESI